MEEDELETGSAGDDSLAGDIDTYEVPELGISLAPESAPSITDPIMLDDGGYTDLDLSTLGVDIGQEYIAPESTWGNDSFEFRDFVENPAGTFIGNIASNAMDFLEWAGQPVKHGVQNVIGRSPKEHSISHTEALKELEKEIDTEGLGVNEHSEIYVQARYDALGEEYSNDGATEGWGFETWAAAIVLGMSIYELRRKAQFEDDQNMTPEERGAQDAEYQISYQGAIDASDLGGGGGGAPAGGAGVDTSHAADPFNR